MQFTFRLAVCVLLAAGFCGCTQKRPLLVSLDASRTGIAFNNRITESDSLNASNFEYLYNGGGVGVGDFNNDGLQDIFFAGNQVPSRLYLNQGNLQFKDITAQAGIRTPYWSTGVSLADVNGDGWLDIYLCTIHPRRGATAPNQLFINQGTAAGNTPTFREAAARAGLADSGYATQAAFFDYDKDGDLDVYLLTNALEEFDRSIPRGQRHDGSGRSTDRLYRNEGRQADGLPRFENVSRAAGITTEGWGLGICVADVNQDGWPDVYCANDFQSNDLLWMNNGNGTFTNRIAASMKHQSLNSMGADIADINNDGLPDVVTLDMMPEDNLRQKTMFSAPNYERYTLNTARGYQPQFVRNMLQLNNGPVHGGNPPGGAGSGAVSFSEIGQLAGVYATDWSWSALLADFDNDGYRDLFITNGYPKDVTDLDFIAYGGGYSKNFYFDEQSEARARKETEAQIGGLSGVKKANVMFRNRGDLTFEDVTAAWGLNLPSYSHGAAYADLDNDGDLDIVVNNINDNAFLYENTASDQKKEAPNHYLRIKLTGRKGNPDGFGAKVAIRYGNQQQYAEQSPYRGYKSTVEPFIHFGLGPVGKIDTLTVTWPDGTVWVRTDVAPDQTLAVSQGEAFAGPAPPPPQTPSLFTDQTRPAGVAFVHEENPYVDFKAQVLLPHQYSRGGPGLAVGDVDGDGRDDVFVGGPVGQVGRLFRQTAPGRFAAQPLYVSQTYKRYEDMGALFFDADGDQDLDLYLVSGGNEFPADSEWYRDRLYLNDGRGNFTEAPDALPLTTGSGSCVVAADYDRDGDLDLFVGGRVVPRRYPLPARSYLLRNDRGRFTDVTQRVAPGLAQAGMVTAALWTDFDNDTRVDLVVAGEFMPILFFRNNAGRLENRTHLTGLPNTAGWWNSLTGGDFDNDGDTDYVAGNLGLNTRFKASPREPVCVYAKDYDGNGTLDPIFCRYMGGQEYPAHPRDQLTDQIPVLKKRFTTYAAYGKKTFREVLSTEELQGAYVARSEWMQSSYLENSGQGKFSIKPLPTLTQTAPVFSSLAGDYDGDGNLDLLLVGNFYPTDVLAGRYDAFTGQLLKGDGTGNFSVMPGRESGFVADSDARSLVEVAAGEGQTLLWVGSNSDTLKIFGRRHPPGERSVALAPHDFSALITLPGGQTRKAEFYHGSGYLSQSARRLQVPAFAGPLTTIIDYRGMQRKSAP